MLVFDIETNGLLPELDRVHCLHLYDYDKDVYERYDKEAVPKGLLRLSTADAIVGHYIIGFDIPAIKKVYPSFHTTAKIIDTAVLARMVYANIKQSDFGRFSKGLLPGNLIGTHKLEAYGYRLGILKGTYGKGEGDVWAEWNQPLSDYCEQDVRVTKCLFDKIQEKGYSQSAADLEMEVAGILFRQETHGILFDQKKAEILYSQLIQLKAEKLEELQQVFQPWYTPVRKSGKTLVIIPKVGNKTRHITKGCAYTKVELTEFNPGSNRHIEYWLKRRYGWEPEEFTEPTQSYPEGQVKIDEEIISALPYPEVKPLGEYLTIAKRLSQLSDGDEAWLKAVKSDGRIHGYVNTLGTGTRRMSHSKPNLAQVPRVGNPYGKECRELFMAKPGYKLVGCDAAGLELRCLAHYMARYDGGAYGKASVSGRKEDGTDVHTINQRAIGASTRDIGKTWFYAFIYGAGVPKLGKILLNGTAGDAAKVGAVSKSNFAKGLPALKKLGDAVQAKVKQCGHLISIDGQVVQIRSSHSALNFLLQGAGAIIMKRALVILEAKLQALGFTNSEQDPLGYVYEFVLNIHDEYQLEVKEQHVTTVGEAARQAIVEAGTFYNFRCPLDGEWSYGNNWSETH